MLEFLTQCLIVICAIGILTSALVEVLKTVFNIKNQYLLNVLVLIISEALVIGSFIAYCNTNNIIIVWYGLSLSVIGGIISTGVAIFGFDKYFKPLFESVKAVMKYFES